MPRIKEAEITDKRKIFLLLFTRELIINSGDEFTKLEEIYDKEEEKEKKEPVYIPQQPHKKPIKRILTKPQRPIPLPREEKVISAPKIISAPKQGSPVMETSEGSKENMTKSILSEKAKSIQDNKQKPEEKPKITIPKPRPEEGLNIVGPVRIRAPRREISDDRGRFDYPKLRIPEPKLPEEFQYLKPTPSGKEIALGKLQPLADDPNVQTIECEGPDKPIIVTGGMGRKPTATKLSDMEIEEVIKKFSEASKIPAEVGVFKVVVGRFIFSAIISEVVPSRFFIKKMTNQHPNQAKPMTIRK